MPCAAVASSKANGTKREWCPGSLESPATLRRSGRTETLTGQASHTNSSAKGSSKEQKERGRNIGAANGVKGLNLARTSCGEVRSLLALQTLRSGGGAGVAAVSEGTKPWRGCLRDGGVQYVARLLASDVLARQRRTNGLPLHHHPLLLL